MVDRVIDRNGLPFFPFKGEFDHDCYASIVEHAIENEIGELLIIPGRPIEATFHDQTFDLADRAIFAFETASVVSKLLARAVDPHIEEEIKELGSFQTTEYFERRSGRSTPYSRLIEYSVLGDFSIKLRFKLDVESGDEGGVSVSFNSPFGGLHDGSVFKLVSYLDKDSFDALLTFAGNHKASDVTIQPDTPVMAEIGGRLVPITERTISAAEIETAVRYVYGENGPAEVLGGGDLDPAHEVRVKGEKIKRYRVNITGGRMIGGTGMQMTIRTLPSSPIPIDMLGVEPELLAATRPENGICFITGPTGSGKSTLMSSIMRMIVERPDANEKVLEYSSPIEYVFDEVIMPSSIVFQTHVGKHLRPKEKGESIWAYAARNSLRRKPTIIVVGEARDAETIEEAVEISQQGHLVYTTMHTTGVADTIRRAVNVFPSEVRDRMSIDIMGSLRVVCTQILVPKKGGGKVGCREFMIFGESTREKFLRSDMNTWPLLVKRMLNEELVVGKTMAKSALDLLTRDLITEEEFEKVASRGIMS
jgi:defect-in-organelle-trafficking protein DotB